MPNNSLSVSQLKRALQIAEQIHALEAELASIVGSSSGSSSARAEAPASAKQGRKGQRGRRKGSKMSPEGRERIAAAQRARWAKAKSGK